MKILYNLPYICKNNLEYLKHVLDNRKFSGGNFFTKKCEKFLEKKFNFNKVLLTTSCTDALEMTAILTNIKQGDEVIVPSYTFCSTANAFLLRGAKIIFADSENDSPNINCDHLSKIINKNTKCVVIVHYAGFSCDMEKILALKKKYKFYLIEDCAHAIGAKFKKKYLGSLGDFSTFSFHETKNIQSGEGGALVVNNKKFTKRARIILDKGTDRNDFLEGKIKKYKWLDIGSSFLPNELTAAFLFKQLQYFHIIQNKRIKIWKLYYKNLKKLEQNKIFLLPKVKNYQTINGHNFYLLFKNKKKKLELVSFLKKKGIISVNHYTGLHRSNFYKKNNQRVVLKNSDMYTDNLLRLPLYPDLKIKNINKIASYIKIFIH